MVTSLLEMTDKELDSCMVRIPATNNGNFHFKMKREPGHVLDFIEFRQEAPTENEARKLLRAQVRRFVQTVMVDGSRSPVVALVRTNGHSVSLMNK